MAIRVPTANVSLVDMVFQSEKPISKKKPKPKLSFGRKNFFKRSALL